MGEWEASLLEVVPMVSLEALQTTEVCTLEGVTLMIALPVWRVLRGRYLWLGSGLKMV